MANQNLLASSLTSPPNSDLHLHASVAINSHDHSLAAMSTTSEIQDSRDPNFCSVITASSHGHSHALTSTKPVLSVFRCFQEFTDDDDTL